MFTISYTQPVVMSLCLYNYIAFQRGAALDFWTKTQQPPICEAVFKNEYNITRMLIEKGANVDILWKDSNEKCNYARITISAIRKCKSETGAT